LCELPQETPSDGRAGQVDVREEISTTYLHGTDPALLLGNLVLIGWGPAEIEQERKAEGERQVVANCLSRATDWGIPAFIIQVLILALGNKLVVHSVGLMLVMSAFASSVFCFARCIRYAFRAKSMQMDELGVQLTVPQFIEDRVPPSTNPQLAPHFVASIFAMNLVRLVSLRRHHAPPVPREPERATAQPGEAPRLHRKASP
jgi:hypothetical protein